MKTKVYGHLTKRVVLSEIDNALNTYGRDGYKLVSVVPMSADTPVAWFLLFMVKEYTEND